MEIIIELLNKDIPKCFNKLEQILEKYIGKNETDKFMKNLKIMRLNRWLVLVQLYINNETTSDAIKYHIDLINILEKEETQTKIQTIISYIKNSLSMAKKDILITYTKSLIIDILGEDEGNIFIKLFLIMYSKICLNNIKNIQKYIVNENIKKQNRNELIKEVIQYINLFKNYFNTEKVNDMCIPIIEYLNKIIKLSDENKIVKQLDEVVQVIKQFGNAWFLHFNLEKKNDNIDFQINKYKNIIKK